MIVLSFDDDRKFPLVSSLTTVGGSVRLEIVPDGTRRSLRVVTTGEDTLNGEGAIVLALRLHAVDGAPTKIELEVTGDTQPLQIYLEGSDAAGVGLVWELSGVARTGRHVLSALPDQPHDRWHRDGGDDDTVVTPPLTFHRLRMTARCVPTIDIVLHELRVIGDVRGVPAGMADS